MSECSYNVLSPPPHQVRQNERRQRLARRVSEQATSLPSAWRTRLDEPAAAAASPSTNQPIIFLLHSVACGYIVVSESTMPCVALRCFALTTGLARLDCDSSLHSLSLSLSLSRSRKNEGRKVFFTATWQPRTTVTSLRLGWQQLQLLVAAGGPGTRARDARHSRECLPRTTRTPWHAHRVRATSRAAS